MIAFEFIRKLAILKENASEGSSSKTENPLAYPQI